MIKIKLCILSFACFSISQCLAQDCHEIKENETIRLDTEGGPLFQSPVQDQDGLGTCYANAASVALKTVLPNKPDLSYLQLAFAHAEKFEAPKNEKNNIDSAFKTRPNGKVGEELLSGGQVCDTLKAAKQMGACKRSDVALENLIFNSKNQTFQDSSRVQKKIIKAISEYYDIAKDSRNPIKKQNENQEMFTKIILERQKNYTKEYCLRPEIENAENVTKNILAKVYLYLKNKNIRISNLSSVENSFDRDLFLFSLSTGNSINYESKTSELFINIEDSAKNLLKNSYLKVLMGSPSSVSAQDLYLSAVKKISPRLTPAIYKMFFSDLNSSDQQILQKDYDRYVTKNIEECLQQNRIQYFKNADGLNKDFEEKECKIYEKQAKSLQLIATTLSESNFLNIDAVNAFMAQVPHLNYEQAMRELTAPDCSDKNKIQIPDNLACHSEFFNYTYLLEEYIYDKQLMSGEKIEKLVSEAEKNEKDKIQVDYLAALKVVNENVLYVGKTDQLTIDKKNQEIKTIEKRKDDRDEAVMGIVRNKIMKSIVGERKEKTLWEDYVNLNKNKFTTDAISRLKQNKQAVTMSICTRLFEDPNAISLRDGQCEKETMVDKRYASIGGHHAIAVIGVKCLKGKLYYLIQNSWGDWHQIKDTKNKDLVTQHFESEYGKAWINEDELLNNTFSFQSIGLKK
jgi:hypothetical protein